MEKDPGGDLQYKGKKERHEEKAESFGENKILYEELLA